MVGGRFSNGTKSWVNINRKRKTKESGFKRKNQEWDEGWRRRRRGREFEKINL